MEAQEVKRPLVYIASPYTKGDTSVNTWFQCRVFDEMLTEGVVLPYIPLWTHFQHTMLPRPYRDWIEYDLDLIRQANFDACLRLNSRCDRMGDYEVRESSGADGEVELFRMQRKPVFFTKEELYQWANNL